MFWKIRNTFKSIFHQSSVVIYFPKTLLILPPSLDFLSLDAVAGGNTNLILLLP